MADFNLKTDPPDTSLPTTGFLFGADSQSAASPSVYSVPTARAAILSGQSLALFTPLVNQPPASNFATLDTRNSIAVLDFDDTTAESAVFVGVISSNAVLTSGISVRIHWMATSATSGDCRWSAAFEYMNTDLDTDSFDTATAANSAANGTNGVPSTLTLTCTTIDSLVAGAFFRVKITREAADGGDTMTGDAELIAVELLQVA